MLEDQALAGLSSLALLDLSRNQLGTISREALQPLASLQVLRLTGKLFLGAKPSSLSTAEAVESRQAKIGKTAQDWGHFPETAHED